MLSEGQVDCWAQDAKKAAPFSAAFLKCYASGLSLQRVRPDGTRCHW